MAGLAVELDANGSLIGGGNPGGAYALSDANGYSLLAFDDPGPGQDYQWASSADTEGEELASGRDTNRTVTLRYRVAKATAALLETEISKLSQKIHKLRRDGGTMTVTYPSGTVGHFDVKASNGSLLWDHRITRLSRGEITVTLVCGPYIRITEQDLGDNTETSLPVLIFTEASIPGDVPALGRDVIDNDSTVDWWGVIWGQETNRHYTHTTSSGSGALFYEAESRTLLGGSTTALGSGASGGGSNVVRNTDLPLDWLAILSTQASGGGAHLTHVGMFHVLARVKVAGSSAGIVSIALEWGTGDFRRFARNTAKAIEERLQGKWLLVDLGLVTIPPGETRWEGRILGKSTVVGDELDIDWLLLAPAADGYGVAQGLLNLATPTSLTARDEFDQTAGALTGKTLPVGGTWGGAGDPDDFQVETTGKTAQRAVADTSASAGRLALAGTTALTGTVAQVDLKINSASFAWQGLIARYVDANNYLLVAFRADTAQIDAYEVLAGSLTPLTGLEDTGISSTAGVWFTMRLVINAHGQYWIYFGPQGGKLALITSDRDANLATGGTLASGRVGIYDGDIAADTRNYDNFIAWPLAIDAGVYAGQSIAIHHNQVRREDASGTFWQDVSKYEGDHLLVPPSGVEGRSVRTVAKPLYFPEEAAGGVWLDDRIDDISARLFVTPRWLSIPD